MKKLILSFIAIIVVLAFLVNTCDDNSQSKTQEDIVLNAKLYFDGIQFKITNFDSFDYNNVDLTLNDDYELHVDVIPAGQTYVVGILQFSNSDSDRFTFDKKPKELKLICYVGSEIALAKWELNK